MTSKATTVEAYLDELPADRREAISAVRDVVRKHLPEGYEEGIQYGMIGYFVPHSRFKAGYHCDPKQPLPFVHIASQKNYMALYLFCLYGNSERIAKFEADWEATGKKLESGSSCKRFKKLDDVPLDVVGNLIASIPVDAFVNGYLDALSDDQRKKVLKRLEA